MKHGVNHHGHRLAGCVLLLGWLLPALGLAQLQESQRARAVFTSRAGMQAAMDVTLRDETGAAVTLASLAKGRPVVLVLEYLRCEMLCVHVMRGLRDVLGTLPAKPGVDYVVVAVSIDPRDGPALSKHRRSVLLHAEPEPVQEAWHLLVGGEPAIARLAQSVGFGYAWDDIARQYAHPAGFVVLSATGRLVACHQGLVFPPDAVAASLREAANDVAPDVVKQAAPANVVERADGTDAVGKFDAAALPAPALECYVLDSGRSGRSGVIRGTLQAAGLLMLAGMLAAIGWQGMRSAPRS